MIAKSYTQWGVYKKCGAQYKYRYIQRVPEGKKHVAAERGTNIHKVVEEIIKGERPGVPDEYEHLGGYVGFFKSLGDKGAQAEVPFALSNDWKAAEGKPWIRGVIDIILVPDDETKPLFIYELKSGKIWDDHVEQRHFYATVALSLYNRPAAKVFGVYLDLQVNEENDYDRAMLRAYQYQWKNRLELMDKEETHVPNPGPYCRWCPYSSDKGGPCKFSGY